MHTETETKEPRVLEDPRAFYEGRWTKTEGGRFSLKSFFVKKQRFFSRALRGMHQVLLLDAGCGGGWHYLARFGKVVGLDLSLTSLRQALQVYPMASQGSVVTLPFTDAAFDVIVSLDVLGHIPVGEKPQLLEEIYRVLKPGGRTVHYIESRGFDPFSVFASGYPELYWRYILEPEGHVGLEPPPVIFARFREAGFRPLYEKAAYKGLLYVDRFVRYFDNEYCRYSPWIRFLVSLLKPIAERNVLKFFADAAITMGFELFDHIFPDTWAGGVLVCYAKS